MIAQIASRVATSRWIALRLGRRGAVLGQDVGADAGTVGRGLRGRQERARGRTASRYAFLTDGSGTRPASRHVYISTLLTRRRRGRHGRAVRAPSFLNHHWEPNLLVDYGDDDVVFRAARPVKEGDELTIDYIHGLPQEERSAYLMELNDGFDEASEIDERKFMTVMGVAVATGMSGSVSLSLRLVLFP